jgi:hypothetical protein
MILTGTTEHILEWSQVGPHAPRLRPIPDTLPGMPRSQSSFADIHQEYATASAVTPVLSIQSGQEYNPPRGSSVVPTRTQKIQMHQPQVLPPYFAARKKNPALQYSKQAFITSNSLMSHLWQPVRTIYAHHIYLSSLDLLGMPVQISSVDFIESTSSWTRVRLTKFM